MVAVGAGCVGGGGGSELGGPDAADGDTDASDQAEAGADGAVDALDATDADSEVTSDVADAIELELLEDRQGFTAVARVALDSSGVSERFGVPVDPVSRGAFLRVSARDAQPRCFQLDEALTAEGEAWVEWAATQADYGAVCRHCVQRVSVGQGFALFQLPNDGRASLGTARLDLRVGERDCATSLPLFLAPGAIAPADTIDVELLEVRGDAAAPAAGLVLPVRFVVSSAAQFEVGAGSRDQILSEAFELVRAAFSPAGVVVEFRGVVDLGAELEDPLVYSTADVGALRALLDEALAEPEPGLGGLSPLTVVVAGCLRRVDPTTGALRDPQAVTSHVCAGLGPPGVGDGVVLAGHACPSIPAAGYWNAATLATILAHELGHALGLYHVAEASGATDNLDDTEADNLMNADPLGHLNDGFSASQGVVMRAHPLLRPAPAPAPTR
jgi:hypothetical protein